MRSAVVIALLGSLCAAGAGAGGCIRVDGDRILGSDLARANPVFAALDAGLTVGYTPAPGARRIFSAAQLAQLARRHGLAAGGMERACFERTTSPLDRAPILEALEAALGMPDAEIELIDFSRREVPPGQLEFRRRDLRRPVGEAPVLWRGVVRYASRRSLTVWARVKIRARWRQVVAARPLAPGELVAEKDLKVVTVEGFPPAQPPPASIEEVAGRRLRRRVGAGEPLLASALRLPCAVERGEKVQVVVSSGGARIQMEGEAEAAGRVGDRIPVRNPANGKRFLATVEATGRVVVKTDRPAQGT